MTIVKHELRLGLKSFFIWTLVVALMLMMCIFLFPEMKGEMDGVTEMFSSMGSFTAAFGMDRLSFGTLTGYYAIECGNVLGLGGAFYAAFIAISSLAKEEKDRTAEFLFSHPVSRARVLTEKLAALLLQITATNLAVWLLAVVSVAAIGEAVPWRDITLLHTAFYISQLELAAICFGLSAFIRRGSLGVGLGIAALTYFLNLIANISESARFLKYITPFGYTDGADIVSDGALDAKLIAIGAATAAAFIVAAYARYTRKDLS